MQRLLDEVGPVDQAGIEERVAKYTTRSIKKSSKLFGLRLAVSMVDLTTWKARTRRARWPPSAARRCARTMPRTFRRSRPSASIPRW